MGRPLAPCGTFTAYKRHKRKGEPVDAACERAMLEERRGRRESQRAAQAEVVQLEVVKSPPAPESLDELERLRWNLRILEATMSAGVPSGMAALSKQHAVLVARIVKLEAAASPKESKLDELARRRAERRAASSH